MSNFKIFESHWAISGTVATEPNRTCSGEGPGWEPRATPLHHPTPLFSPITSPREVVGIVIEHLFCIPIDFSYNLNYWSSSFYKGKLNWILESYSAVSQVVSFYGICSSKLFALWMRNLSGLDGRMQDRCICANLGCRGFIGGGRRGLGRNQGLCTGRGWGLACVTRGDNWFGVVRATIHSFFDFKESWF